MAGKLGRIRPAKIEDVGQFKLLTLHDGRKKLVPRLDFHFDHRMRTAAPLPDSVDWSVKADAAIKQMYGNDQYGDCVVADYFHQVGLWTGNESGTPVLGTTAEAISAYTTICGPGDQGCVITDVLDYAKTTGITVGGQRHGNDGYVAIDWTNQAMVKTCVQVFGSVRVGINLPQGWYDAPDGGMWDVVTGAAATVIGGHDVGSCAYHATAVGTNAAGVVIMTWAGKRTITWTALAKKPTGQDDWGIEECYAQLAKDWYSQNNLAPNGINAASLAAALQAAGQGTVPPLGPPSPPPPPPPPPPAVKTLFTVTVNRAIARGRNVSFAAPVAIPVGKYGWDVLSSSLIPLTAEASGRVPNVEAVEIQLGVPVTILEHLAFIEAQNTKIIAILGDVTPAPQAPGGMKFRAVGVPGGQVVVTFTWNPPPPGDTGVVYSLQIINPDGTPFAPAVTVPITSTSYSTPPMVDSTATFTMVLTAIDGSNPPLSTPSAPLSFMPHTEPIPPPPVPPAAPTGLAYTVADAGGPPPAPPAALHGMAAPLGMTWQQWIVLIATEVAKILGGQSNVK